MAIRLWYFRYLCWVIPYREEYGPIRSLYYDPRGVLYEPHTGVEVQLGTREVDAYRFPERVYDKILYIEKKGLWPILKAAGLAEKYDMAVVAAEGYATEAVRTLFRQADKEQDYQLFVLHDADPAGYNIARTLSEETRRMPGYHVDVIDLGLKLEDALDIGLETEEFTRKKALPKGLELTETERRHFEGRQVGSKSWICARVELNALSGPELVEYIQRKLEEAGATGKVIPPEEHVEQKERECARDKLRDRVRGRLEEMLSGLEEDAFSNLWETQEEELIQGNTYEQLSERLGRNPSVSWKAELSSLLNSRFDEDTEDEIDRVVERTIGKFVTNFEESKLA